MSGRERSEKAGEEKMSCEREEVLQCAERVLRRFLTRLTQTSGCSFHFLF